MPMLHPLPGQVHHAHAPSSPAAPGAAGPVGPPVIQALPVRQTPVRQTPGAPVGLSVLEEHPCAMAPGALMGYGCWQGMGSGGLHGRAGVREEGSRGPGALSMAP